VRALHSGRGLHNVPAELTSFVGRRRELAEIKQRLGASRLLTLTGTGGVGKTRLALRAASDLARAFPDGVWFVPLAPIEDPQLVTQAVFHALGLQDRSAGWALSALTDYLAEKHLLVIFDNCEHLLDRCAVLATTLLTACPELRLLVTSRQPLGIAGETRMLVPPLSMPEGADAVAVARLLSSDAVRLLSERAAAVLPSFAVDASNAAAVLNLCRRLDGIALALELAAARLGSWSVDQLNQRLATELSILGAGNRGAESRQQTLESTIAWSYGLLDEDERLLWARLSVFAGGFDEEAAIEVCSDQLRPADRIVDLLGTLVEKSILKRELRIGEVPRYWLLETLRQYGRLRLRDLGEETTMRKRHFDWILALAKSVGAWDSRQAKMVNHMYQERDNLWAALDFCLTQPGEVTAAAELAQDLMVYWECRGPWRDVYRVLMSLAELAPPDSLPRARLLWVAATTATAQNDYAGCGELSRESLRIGKLVKDDEVVAWSSFLLSVSRLSAGDAAGATELAQSALSLTRLMKLKLIEMQTLNVLCMIAVALREPDRAVQFGEQAMAISRECGELWDRGYVLNFMSQARWMRGERERAENEAKEGAICKHALDDRNGLAFLLETLAWMAAESGAHQRAATLLGAAEHVRELSFLPSHSINQEQHEHSVAIAVQEMGKSAFDAAFARGRAMTIDEGAAFAVDQKEPVKPKPASAAAVESPITLTIREQEIAALVSKGLTNKQIAAKLVISERTAEYHILNILNKLGFNSRTQIASWEATHQPVAPTPKGLAPASSAHRS